MNPLDRAVAVMVAERASAPATAEIARDCAAAVLNLWCAPAVVRTYLMTAAPELRAEAAYEAWSTVRDLRSAGWQVHAARAAARAIDGAPMERVLSAAAAAVGSHAGTVVPGRGVMSYLAERRAVDAFRAVWQPRLCEGVVS